VIKDLLGHILVAHPSVVTLTFALAGWEDYQLVIYNILLDIIFQMLHVWNINPHIWFQFIGKGE